MTRADKDGKVEWARPVCVYPQVARYKGSGDTNSTNNRTNRSYHILRRL